MDVTTAARLLAETRQAPVASALRYSARVAIVCDRVLGGLDPREWNDLRRALGLRVPAPNYHGNLRMELEEYLNLPLVLKGETRCTRKSS